MPEGLEAEIWRTAMESLLGRVISAAWVDERVADARLVDLLPGCTIERVRRGGKAVLLDTDGPTVGLHFGMTGRVVVDGVAPIDRLEYASGADRAEWDRLRLFTSPRDGRDTRVPALRMNDPRRLGRISLDPDVGALGVDMFDVSAANLRAAFGRRRAAVKTVLLDQHAVAGIGNLCADEILWWAGIAPQRPVDTLTADEITTLAAAIRRRLPIMLRRGGSIHGTLAPSLRAAEFPCPRDGVPMRRASLGGRTAIWCPVHQR